MTRAMRISWIVSIGLIALFLLEVALNGEPFYSQLADSRMSSCPGMTRDACCYGGAGDACRLQVFLLLNLILLLPAALLILWLYLVSVYDSARHRRWLWLVVLVAPVLLTVACLVAYVNYWWGFKIDRNIGNYLLIACAAAAFIAGLAYVFLPGRWRTDTHTNSPMAEPLGDSPA